MRNLGNYVIDEFAREVLRKEPQNLGGVYSKQIKSCGISGVEVTLDKNNYLNKPAGKYFTFEIEKYGTRTYNKLKNLIKISLKKLLPKVYKSVLLLGMGNSFIISDTLGVKTIENVDILKLMKLKDIKIAKFAPSVFAVSGLESFDVVKSLVGHLLPDVVIVVDSLCTKEISRLGKSFQITDAGIVPGSAVGSKVCNLSSETLNTKVISIGVPMVVYLNSVVLAVLDRIKPPNPIDLEALNRDFGCLDAIFSPKDIDFMIDFTAEIISQAIFEAL